MDTKKFFYNMKLFYLYVRFYYRSSKYLTPEIERLFFWLVENQPAQAND